MYVYLNGKRLHLDPRKSVGKGGEADVFAVKDLAVKIWKTPDHPDLKSNPVEQQAAEDRIQFYQQKLQTFPRNTPSNVIAPQDFVTDKTGNQILGYTMSLLKNTEPLLRYGERAFRTGGINNATVQQIFIHLHRTVRALHQSQIVIGDFNDLNVLVQDENAYLIDADSFQYGNYHCQMFTTRFVDPLLCDPAQNTLLLCQPHTVDSDWYAYALMVMRSLLFVGPYGGMYKPKDLTKQILHDARPLHRITVFHADVKYPKPALPLKILSDDLLQYFHQTFVEDRRGVFPELLLTNMRWTKCTVCQTEHARAICPECSQVAPASIKAVTSVRGTVVATVLFRTSGVILDATMIDGKLNWLVHENESFRREDDSTVMAGKLDPRLKFGLLNHTTLVGRQQQLLQLEAKKPPQSLAVETVNGKPMFACNGSELFWIDQGRLQKQGKLGAEHWGDVLPNQTRIWVGNSLSFGFYRAGNLSVAFLFHTKKSGINDQLKLPRIHGQLLKTHCVFASDKVWFFTTTQEQRLTVHRCVVLNSQGKVLATATHDDFNNHWVNCSDNKFATGNQLFTATDDGIIRIDLENGVIQQKKEFPDTEPFVDASCRLLPSSDGIYVIASNKITLLKIS